MATVLLALPWLVGAPQVHAAVAFESPPLWNKAVFRASKFGFSLDAILSIGAAGAVQRLIAWPDGYEGEAVQAADQDLIELIVRRNGLGRDTHTALVLDRGNAAAIQRVRLESGRHRHFKTTRFGTEGISVVRRKPLRGEERLAPETWGDVKEKFKPYPAGSTEVEVITDPLALFYVLASADLGGPSNGFRLLVFIDGYVMNFKVKVAGYEEVQADYYTGGERRVERVRALRVKIDMTHNGGAIDDEEIRVLGMKGDFEVFLDSDRRVPLLIRGRVPYLGRVDVRLRELIPRV
ncbi:MAG: hypothetical protein QGI55_16685 [Pseudomonadales bacterium]|jgi:hypothetical protein|nr:hypothetical protein [Pseudomonadales bacterium]|tara:strand:+ start:1502 stop:2380 length:879 start_codon:yes stop_codon:yes gene_type:complete